jgi:hypothetical protein
MFFKRGKESGFVVIPIIIIVVILVGVAGIYYYESNESDKTPKSSQSATSSASESATSKKSPTPAPFAVSVTDQTPKASSVATSKPSPSQTPTPSILSDTPFRVDSVTPSSAKYGETVTVKGSGFGTYTQAVLFYNLSYPNAAPIESSVVSKSETEVKTSVPPGKGAMQIAVKRTDGSISNKISFTITASQPIIRKMLGVNFVIGGKFSLEGQELGATQGTLNIIDANTNQKVTNCPITNWANTGISCAVPTTLTANKEYGLQAITADGRESSLVYYTALSADNSGIVGAVDTTSVTVTLSRANAQYDLVYGPGITLTSNGITGWSMHNNEGTQGQGFYESSGGIVPGNSAQIRTYINTTKPNGTYTGSYTLIYTYNNGTWINGPTIYYTINLTN